MHREDNMTINVGIAVMWPQAKECWQPPEARRSWNRFSLTAFGGCPTMKTPWFWPSDTDFRLKATRIVRENISVVLSHQENNTLE